MKRPFVSLWLVVCCLFGCLAALEGYGKRQEAVCGQRAADLKLAVERMRQEAGGKPTTGSSSGGFVSTGDTGQASAYHLRRLDESEAFQPLRTRIEEVDTGLQSMYPGGLFLVDLWPATGAGLAQIGAGNEWMESFYRVADWLNGRAGKSFSYGMLNGF